jgi:hypothetical protein
MVVNTILFKKNRHYYGNNHYNLKKQISLK